MCSSSVSPAHRTSAQMLAESPNAIGEMQGFSVNTRWACSQIGCRQSVTLVKIPKRLQLGPYE
jgi:hypothetical protein